MWKVSDRAMWKQVVSVSAIALLVAGCTSNTPTAGPGSATADPPPEGGQSLEPANVTFYVAGMNRAMKIL